MARSSKTLAQTLLDMGALDPLQLQAATAHAQQWDMALHQAVVERKFCSKDDVVHAFSLQTGYPVIQLDSVPLSPVMADLLPLKLAEQLRVVPLRLSGKRYEVVEIAMAVPAEMSSIDAVLSVTRKVRAVVHLANDEAVARALDRIYRPAAAPVAQPAAPAYVPMRANEVQNETEFELEVDSPPAPGQSVKLYGWHPAAMRALQMMLDRGGMLSEPLDDSQLDALAPDDVLISTTLGLRVAIGPAAKVRALLIICGTNEAGDAEDARALGARLFLRPPLSTEQLVAAISRVRK